MLCVPPHWLLVRRVAYATVSFATTGSHRRITSGEMAVLNFFGVSGSSTENICTTLVEPMNSLSLKG